MIEKFIFEDGSEENYEKLSEDRKIKYQRIWEKATYCPDQYVLSVDIAQPNSKDNCVAIKFNYEEFLKGNKVIENIEYF